MKYLRDSFSSGGNSDSYRDGWDRVFGKSVCTCRYCGISLILDIDKHVVNSLGVFCTDFCHDAFIEFGSRKITK